MSHRIIISSSAGGVPASETAAAMHQTPAAIDINVQYTPHHGETDQQAMARAARLMKLVRKMEAVALEAPGAVASEDASAD